MDTVYAVQIPMRRDAKGDIREAYDLTPAHIFGDVVQLLPPGPVLLEPHIALRTLYSKLDTFDETDHLLCLGDPVAIAAAAMVASDINDGVVRVLVYDRHRAQYNSVTIDIREM